MSTEYIEIDLDKEEKAAILKYADFFISDPITKKDLSDGRKKWVRFKRTAIRDVIGELSYHFNRMKDNYQFYLLDRVILHLESYE